MRTSRISATTSSTFRNDQPYLHASDVSHNFNQHAKKQFQQNMRKNKEQQRTTHRAQGVQHQMNALDIAVVSNAQDLHMHNELNETATKLNRLSKQKKLLKSYRSSI
ncbi:NAD synthetase [Lysinibacillus piscis]|uniref:NAD synthetase n=1 Tax=Lysinibacillus piscis TaxID=2518931 RepID=A0ABQ5NPJ2_9BACI|nr:NAD synthetase [Lysinibacillus sp. KH24]GLC90264.1 hypothetical protein LYSBPC_33910 [Lysinibacillus sp. KH24]